MNMPYGLQIFTSLPTVILFSTLTKKVNGERKYWANTSSTKRQQHAAPWGLHLQADR